MKIDGRVARGDRQRDAIKTALMELISDGNYAPSAVDVASKTGITVRTVFRHFATVEDMYAGITDEVRAQAFSIARVAVDADKLHDRFEQMVSSRAAVFEEFLPYAEFQYINRHQSNFLRDSYKAGLHESRLILTAALTGFVDFSELRFKSLEMLFSPANWRVLRMHYDNSAQEAANLILETAKLIYPDNVTAAPNLHQEQD